MNPPQMPSVSPHPRTRGVSFPTHFLTRPQLLTRIKPLEAEELACIVASFCGYDTEYVLGKLLDISVCHDD